MKKLISFILSLTIIFMAFSFDWPQENVTKDSYNSYFGQNRGGIISTSIVFSKPAEVKAAEKGHLIIVLDEENDDTDFFPSTLGTSVIIAHEDNLLSVYGNIDSDTLNKSISETKEIEAGQVLGHSGSSAWKRTNGNLEFQIVDINNNTAINPKILMPRSNVEIPLTLTGIVLQDKSGRQFDINKTKSYNSGLYRIYQKKNNIASPYRTTIAINGVTLDQITYDTISQENGKSCVSGKKKYTSSDVYPDDELQLIGEVNLTPGKATLSIYTEDILSNMKQLNYNISIF